MRRIPRPWRVARAAEAPDPWWAPVGLWQSWLGIGFLLVAAVLSHWS